MYEKLAKLALDTRAKAYAPYSHFRVGVALLTDDGEVYTGANIENASYGATICAERVAISQAVLDGHRKFEAIAIAGASEDEEVIKPCYPCGICTQTLTEFLDKSTKVILVANKGYEILDFVDIVPRAFDKGNL